METLHIGQVKVPYELSWSNSRTTVGLKLNGAGILKVKVPQSLSADDALEVLAKKKPWILDKLYGLQSQKNQTEQKEFLSGEKFFYNGRRYPLKVAISDKKESLQFTAGRFKLQISNYKNEINYQQRARNLFTDWYKNRAAQDLTARIKKISNQMGLKPTEISITDSIRNWGSEKNGHIKLHWRLILAPTNIQDYVIAHELSHLKHRTHQDGFWDTVGSVIPDYKKREEWLRKQGNILNL